MIPGPQTVAMEIRSLSPVSRQDQLRLGDSELSMRAHSHSKSDEVLRTISDAHRLLRCPSVPPHTHVIKALVLGLGVNRTLEHTSALM